MFIRIPRVLVLPLLGIGAVVAVGSAVVKGVSALTARPSILVYAADRDVDVEVVDGQKVEAKQTVAAGQHAIILLTKGNKTVRAVAGGERLETPIELGTGERFAVPTSKDTCFAIVDVSSWYGRRGSASPARATVLQRETVSATLKLDEHVYASASEIPGRLEGTERPRVLTTLACARMKEMSDAPILATVEHDVTDQPALKSAAKARVDLRDDLKQMGRDTVVSRVRVKHPDWRVAYNEEGAIAWSDPVGDFVLLDAAAIPDATKLLDGRRGAGVLGLASAVDEVVAGLDRPGAPGVYRKTDVLPSLSVRADAHGLQLEPGTRAGFVLYGSTRSHRPLPDAVVDALGIDAAALASTNAKARFAAEAAACVARLKNEPVTCGKDLPSATAILFDLLQGEPDKTPRVWVGADDAGLLLAKPSKAARAAFANAELEGFAGTVDAKTLKSGLAL